MNNFKSLGDVYEYYDQRVVKLVNIKQILFYADSCNLQPDWISKSVFDNKLIAYYGMDRSKDAYEYWKSTRPKDD